MKKDAFEDTYFVLHASLTFRSRGVWYMVAGRAVTRQDPNLRSFLVNVVLSIKIIHVAHCTVVGFGLIQPR